MAKPKRRPLTDAKRQQRRDEDRRTATAAVEALKSSEGWQAWLTVRRRFHTYSLGNQLLIAMQRPDVTRVAGFRAWLALGYCVRRGGKAIRIWTPIPPSKTKLEAWKATGAVATDKPRTVFRLGSVFDRSQVQELPPPAEPVDLEPPFEPVTGDTLGWALPVLKDIGASIGSAVTFETLPEELGGFYERATRRIVVNDRRALNGRVAVLIPWRRRSIPCWPGPSVAISATGLRPGGLQRARRRAESRSGACVSQAVGVEARLA